MKVIATEPGRQRVVIDAIDSLTAAMTAQVLNDAATRAVIEKLPESKSVFYSVRADDYAVPMGAET